MIIVPSILISLIAVMLRLFGFSDSNTCKTKKYLPLYYSIFKFPQNMLRVPSNDDDAILSSR